MTSMRDGHVRGPALLLAIAALFVAMGAWLRWRAGTQDGLWFDEVFAASYVQLGVFETVVAVLRFDIHPPLYYLQLNAWSVLGNSDVVLLWNSVAWSLLTICLVMWAAWRRAGAWAAMVAGVLITFCGSELYFATELRMYSMLSALLLVAWLFIDAWSTTGDRRHAIGAATAIFFIAGSHSAAFVSIGCLLAYLGLCFLRRQTSLTWREMLFFGAWTFVCLAPWLVNASFRSVSHTQSPSIQGASTTLGGWLLGYFPGMGDQAASGAVAFLAVLVATGLCYGKYRSRALLLSMVVLPVLIVALVSWLVRPIWLDRSLAFVAPFLVLGIVLGLADISHAWIRRISLTLTALVWLTMLFVGGDGLHERLSESRKMEFRRAAIELPTDMPPLIDVYVPSNVRFWAMARYLVGPSWGSMLAIQDPSKPDKSSTWESIYKRLGDEWLQRLGLKPTQRWIELSSRKLWVGWTPLPQAVISKGYIFVGDSNDAGRDNACPQGIERSRKVYRGLVVAHCQEKAGG